MLQRDHAILAVDFDDGFGHDYASRSAALRRASLQA
jgi:hypothetical protein